MAISFKGAHFSQDIILMGVRWYVAYPLSYRHVEELMEERGVPIDHATIQRWVVKYINLSRLNHQGPKCEVHPETMEGEQNSICACNAASKDGMRRCTSSTVTLGISRNAGGRDSRLVVCPS